MRILYAASMAVSFLAGMSPADAQDIALTSHDGKVEVTGNLLGYDGEFYRIDTQFGELTVDGSGVTCDGPACPSLTDFVAEIRFSGASVMAEALLPALIDGFAHHEGLTTSRSDLGDGQFAYALHQSGRQAPLGRLIFRAADTERGFADLTTDETDIVLALREVRRPRLRRRVRPGWAI